MTKLLVLKIEKCVDCPYSEWEYPSCAPERFCCKKVVRTIATDYELRKNKVTAYEWSIPDWCPLEEKEKYVS